ncbi:MAG: zf-HC2 domain-containing protein [Chloroflexi bacterium]|nr:zf-HC2 domain-containing protein [Chloroflexota bacterium]
MSPCEELRLRGSDLIDGDCDEATAARLNSHLDECVDCDGWLSSVRATIGLLQNLPKSRPPGGLIEQIRQATTRRSH